MSSLEDQIAQLEAALVAQATMRSTLGDAVVDVTLAALHVQIDQLRRQLAQPVDQDTLLPVSRVQPSSEELLARAQSYLPKELADKMRASGAIEGEHRLVTVLFADISNFTSLSERLEPEVVTALTNDVLKEWAEVVYQYEGYIDKFLGDAIMAVFGATVAHEDDPDRALRAALAMADRLKHLNQRWIKRLSWPVEVHIAVNTGPVIAGNVGSDLRLSYTVMGDTVNIASRLVDLARASQILVSHDTHRLTQEAFIFKTLTPLSLKGKREPLQVFELISAKRYPGKTRGLKGLASTLIGREREMADLDKVLGVLVAGQGRVVTVNGEAGIGKSRLMAEARDRMGDDVYWLEGRSLAHTTSLAYGPWIDLLLHFAGVTDTDSESQARSRLDEAVEGIFAGNGLARAILADVLSMRLAAREVSLIANLPAETLRDRLLALMDEWLVWLAQRRPTLVVMEDVHWADLSSIELIEHLLPLTKRLPLAIILVFRPQSGDPLSRLLEAIRLQPTGQLIDIPLAPLSESDSVQLVEQLLSLPQLPDNLRRLIVNKAEGNPFFVEEVIRSLIERGALVRAASGSGWVATRLIDSVIVPGTLQGLLMERLDRLPAETKWVLQQAAVIGRIFRYRVLQHMSDQAASLDADLAHLERDELIRVRTRYPELEYIFKHALTQEVAAQSLLAPRRRELHRKVGEAMEAVLADRLNKLHSVVGDHYLRGEAWEKAVHYLLEAGDAAARLNAHAEARVHYTSALEALSHLGDTEANRRRHIDTIIKFVNESFTAESPAVNLKRLVEVEILAQTLIDSSNRSASDRLRLAGIHYWMGRLHLRRNATREAITYFQRVLPVAEEFGDAELFAIPCSMIGRMQVWQGQFGKAGPLLALAIAPLEMAADWPEWISTVGHFGVSLAARGHYASSLAQGQRALTRALEMGYFPGVTACHGLLAASYLLAGDLPQLRAESSTILEAAQQFGDQPYIALGLILKATAESGLGNHTAALACLAEARQINQNLTQRILPTEWFTALSADIKLKAGQITEALALAAEALVIAESTESRIAEGLAQRVWGLALAESVPAGQSPQWDEVETHLATSLVAFKNGDANLEVARTHMAWGKICRDRAYLEVATDHLQKAAHQFKLTGRTEELTQTQQLLDALKPAAG